MKTFSRLVIAALFVGALATGAQAATLYTVPLKAAAGDCLVCGALTVVNSAAFDRVDITVQKADGSGEIVGGYCTGAGTVGNYCEMIPSSCVDAQTGYCKITVKYKTFVRGTLQVVNPAGETVSTVPAQ